MFLLEINPNMLQIFSIHSHMDSRESWTITT